MMTLSESCYIITSVIILNEDNQSDAMVFRDECCVEQGIKNTYQL